MNPLLAKPLRLAGALALGAASLMSASAAADMEFFEKRIRPIFVERCYECHSASANKFKGGLALDSKDGWSRGGDSGPAVIPGDVERSLLVKAIRWNDPDTQMPPKNKLPQSEIDALTAWVQSGAPDPRLGKPVTPAAGSPANSATNHWAYQPVNSPSPPSVSNRKWPRGAIDQFILARLESAKLKPVPDADPETLCRRLYFDLIGLPPTPEQLDVFASAARRDRNAAVASLVDDLMDRREFGEHWGRHWLDVVRFGESLTLRGFIYKEAWRYRDYVIDAFNRDAPFDQFIREHIAGDLLPHTSLAQQQRQMIATTFLVMGNWNLEEQDKEQLDMDVVDEQLDTLGKAFLGQTIGCARCHDHKFDPIPTRDYYALAGIFKACQTLKHANVSEWLEAPLPVEPEMEKRLQEHELAVGVLKAKIKETKESMSRIAGGVRTTGTDIVSPKELPGIIVDSAQARAVGEWKHSQVMKPYIGDGYLHDENTGKGTKTLSFAPEITRAGRYELRLAYSHAESRATNVPVTIFHADGETTVHINQRNAPALDGRFVSLGQYRFEANGFGYALISNEGTHGFVTADAVQFLPADAPAGVPIAAGQRPSTNDQAVAGLQSELSSLEAQLKRLQEKSPRRPMVLAVKETGQPTDLPVHIRGSVHNLGTPVPRGFLSVISRTAPPAMPTQQSGRRELADWIASPVNPLTARMFVNRTWLWLTGEGLVRSADNFGTTGDAPTHPELLDHLSTRFVAEGWSVKKLVREIVLSRTYQLSAVPSTRSTQSDPENKLLSHARRRRLSAEQLRDGMLAISGLLQHGGSGPSYPASLGADYGFVFNEPRRSVYAPVFRNALPDFFEAFDFAPSSMVTGKRSSSTVPTQALLLLNHPFVREKAAAAAEHLLKLELPDNVARIHHAHRLALGRDATSAERRIASRHLDTAGLDARDAWTEILHALFASADFRYLD